MSYKSKTAGHQYNICFYHMYHLYILMYDTLINNFLLFFTLLYSDVLSNLIQRRMLPEMLVFRCPSKCYFFIHLFIFFIFFSFITKTCLFKYIEDFTSKSSKNFQIKTPIFFLFHIDCGYSLEPPRRGGSNEYPQSMFLSKNKKNNVYPCKPQFYYIKVGLKGVNII